ncbi:MAG: GH92 family glycosyl hydrolase [Chloroflexota bacterium]
MHKRPVDWVNPLIDTANRRFFFFSSACHPFGMVNLSPDTIQDGAWGSGYRYTEPYILWFSHIHAWQLAGIPVLPTTGPFKGDHGSRKYRSRFSHDNEIVQAGYHRVYLDDYDVEAELTATTRVGFHRYRFNKPDQCHILFDLGAEVGSSEMSDFYVEQVHDRELSGYVENAPTRRRPRATRIYFVIQFDTAFASFGGWQHGKQLLQIEQLQGPDGGVYVTYQPHEDQVVQLKVAISYCNVEQARLNLETECDHWDFDRVRNDALDTWNEWLSRIQVEGGTDAQKTKFYTDLYHALLGRRRASDVNGKYSDMTGSKQVIRQIPLDDRGHPLYEHHNSDAFWGAQWNINLLWCLAYPEIIHNFCNTFLDIYRNGGLIPRGPSGGNYTFVMTSPSSTHLFAAAYHQGIRTFDIEMAYAGLLKNHGPGGLMSRAGYEHQTAVGGGVEHYLEKGYVPEGIKAEAFHLRGAGQTLEYAFCDWSLAQLAASLGHQQDYDALIKRAGNYHHIYNAETGFMQPRQMNGDWLEPFDPMAPEGWVEGNGWQYLWHVPHDVAGLIDLMGGREKFIQRLEEVFVLAEPSDFIAPHSEHHLNYLDYGNQPSLYIAHLFTYAGTPWLTQKWIHRIMTAAKSDVTPYGGYGGDEDQGQMGALNVLMAIGLFSITGGANQTPFYEITSPIFDRIVIQLDRNYYTGSEFVITTENNQPENIYIQSARLNGETLDQAWFLHETLVQGGELHLELGPEPNKEWGRQAEEIPTSIS